MLLVRYWIREQRKLIILQATFLSMMQANFLFVAPKRSWKISRLRLVLLVTFAILMFSLLVGISIFQFFSYRIVIAKMQNNYEQQIKTNEQLSSDLKQLEDEHLYLERQVDQKKFLLAVTEHPQAFEKEDKTDLEVKETELVREIAELQNTLNARDARIANLKAQNLQSHTTVQALFQKIPDVKKQVLSQSTSAPVVSIPFHDFTPPEIMVDQFRMTVKSNSIQVQFNIRNTGEKTQSGFVIVRALRENEVGVEIPFKRSESMRFVIRRFRPFSTSFKQNPTDPFVALRVIVWDSNEKRLLEDQYVVE